MADYIETLYGRTRRDDAAAPPLDGPLKVEVCVVGGGMAGLATALDLAERGRSVSLIERHRVGWGASGRNGGFVNPGLPVRVQDMVDRFGMDDARAFYALSRMGLALVRERLDRYRIDCDRVDGTLRCRMTNNGPGLHAMQDLMARHFGSEQEYWGQNRVREALHTTRYGEALLNREGFSVQPLDLTRGMARAFQQAGGRLYEQTPATRLRLGLHKSVHTPRGVIHAQQVVLALGGHAGWLNWRLGGATIPVQSYVMATAPLPEAQRRAIGVPYSVFDDSTATNYYRLTPDHRLVWGGRVGIGPMSPARIGAVLRRDAASFYPALLDVPIEAAWCGSMPYTRTRMPSIGQLRPGAWYATGFGGLGMALTTMAGRLIADGIAGTGEDWRRFERFGLPFAGGRLAQVPAQLVYMRHRAANRLARAS